MQKINTLKSSAKSSDKADYAALCLSDAESALGLLLGLSMALSDGLAHPYDDPNAEQPRLNRRVVRGSICLASAIEDAAEAALEHIEAARITGRAETESVADRASRLAFELADTMNYYSEGRWTAHIVPSRSCPDYPVSFRPLFKPTQASAPAGGDNYDQIMMLLDERRERVAAHEAAIAEFSPLERGPRNAKRENAERRLNAALEAQCEIEKQILELPALSLRDLRVKLDLVDDVGNHDDSWLLDDDHMRALLQSLRGLLGGGDAQA